jgi:hypothetical protein
LICRGDGTCPVCKRPLERNAAPSAAAEPTSRPVARPLQPEQDISTDVGPLLLNHVFAQMQIDAPWSVREPRAFTWWGHRLAQRVWVDQPRPSRGVSVVRAYAETDVLRVVPKGQKVLDLLAALNMEASLSALVLDEATSRLSYRCGMYVHPQNFAWARSLFLHAMSIQADDANARVEWLAKYAGGQPAYSAHPTSGERHEPDGMLSVVRDCFVSPGQGPSTFSDRELEAIAQMEPRPWTLATGGPGGLTAEFPFTGSVPAMGTMMGIRSGPGPLPETALCTVSTDQPHPQLGSGALIRLHLPVTGTSRMAADLNFNESNEWAECHQLGAWCRNGTDVVFVTFLPSAAWAPGLMQSMLFSTALRARWAACQLGHS